MSLHDAIQAERAKYPPESHSAVLPALRLAQAEHGWLSPDVIREVADALETTPAYVKSIASYYDLFHLAPVGEHLVVEAGFPRAHGVSLPVRGRREQYDRVRARRASCRERHEPAAEPGSAGREWRAVRGAKVNGRPRP